MASALHGADLALVFIGTGGGQQVGEGKDMQNITLFGQQQRLIDDALAAQPARQAPPRVPLSTLSYGERGAARVLEYARLAMGFANVRAGNRDRTPSYYC